MKKRFVFYSIFIVILSSISGVILHANKWHNAYITERIDLSTKKITDVNDQLELLNISLEEQEQKLAEQEQQNEKLRLTNITQFNTAIVEYNADAERYNQEIIRYAELEEVYNTAIDEQKIMIENIQTEFFLEEYWQHIQSKIL